MALQAAEIQRAQARTELEQKSAARKQTELAYYDALYEVQNQLNVISGSGFIYDKDNAQAVTIKINGSSHYFNAIRIDDQLLDTSEYDVDEGSTIITLHQSILKALKDGLHAISYEYEYGKVTNTFMVKSAEQVSKDSAITANNKQQNSAEASAPRITQKTPKTPKTGDTSNVGGALGMLVAGVSTVGLSLRKKYFD